MTLAAHPGAPFVNREDELLRLRSLLPPECFDSSLLFIKSPPGFGKSALTTRLLQTLAAMGEATAKVVLDPSVRTGAGEARLHDGFFIQRLAEELSDNAAQRYDSLGQFLRKDRWQIAARKKLGDVAQKIPTHTTLYNDVVDFVKQVRARGDRGVYGVITSDARAAVELCEDYVEAVCRERPLITVVREAQHIDHESLRFLLTLNRTLSQQHLIFEYSASGNLFDPDHDKEILKELASRPRAHILDLDRLDRENLERLIHYAVDSHFAVTPDYYRGWSGNLRSVLEMKYQLDVQRGIAPSELSLSLTDFVGQMNRHLRDLTRTEHFLLALLSAHVEAIDRRVLFEIASTIATHYTSTNWNDALESLKERHGFIDETHGWIRFQSEDVAAAVTATAQFSALYGLAQRALRDYYIAIVTARNYHGTPMAIAVRQALIQCAKSRDITLLIEMTRRLSDEVQKANDQSIYVDCVTSAIVENTKIFGSELTTLVDWAAGLAFGTSDFKRTVRSLELVHEPDAYQGIMLACAMIEVGREIDVLERVQYWRTQWFARDARLALDLVEMFAYRALGNINRTRELFDEAARREDYRSSPFYGFVFRFAESIMGFPECTENALKSARLFGEAGLVESEAYSTLAAAMHLAREGSIAEAVALVDHASEALLGHVRDQHLALTDRAAVHMLIDEPDFAACRDWLLNALRLSRDDYSDAVILNNLAIANEKLGALDEAVTCVNQMLTIFEDPTFTEPDILWGAIYTATSVYKRAGLIDRATAAAAIRKQPPIGNARFWEYRYGLLNEHPGPQYEYLLKFDYYPQFLSHWSIDRDAIEMLRKRSRR